MTSHDRPKYNPGDLVKILKSNTGAPIANASPGDLAVVLATADGPVFGTEYIYRILLRGHTKPTAALCSQLVMVG